MSGPKGSASTPSPPPPPTSFDISLIPHPSYPPRPTPSPLHPYSRPYPLSLTSLSLSSLFQVMVHITSTPTFTPPSTCPRPYLRLTFAHTFTPPPYLLPGSFRLPLPAFPSPLPAPCLPLPASPSLPPAPTSPHPAPPFKGGRGRNLTYRTEAGVNQRSEEPIPLSG